MSKETNYALKCKSNGKLLTYSVIDGGFTLSTDDDNTWYVNSPEQAEYVRRHSTDWYNADYDTPGHNFKAAELEVVKVTVTVETEVVDVGFPSFEEIARFLARGDEKEYEFCIWQKKENPDVHHSWWELTEEEWRKLCQQAK